MRGFKPDRWATDKNRWEEQLYKLSFAQGLLDLSVRYLPVLTSLGRPNRMGLDGAEQPLNIDQLDHAHILEVAGNAIL